MRTGYHKVYQKAQLFGKALINQAIICVFFKLINLLLLLFDCEISFHYYMILNVLTTSISFNV